MFESGLDYLNSRLMFGMRPGLKTTIDICKILGNPQNNFKTIHIVGTNGKGSASYYLSGILQAHGLKVGLYTSPHLVSIRERIRINDLAISSSDLNRLLLKVKEAALVANIEPTFFEVLTIVAFLYFSEQKIDVVAMEAGMGGHFDSTAVAKGNIVVLTSIGLEHTEILGSTEALILKEKLAIAEARNINEKVAFVIGSISDNLKYLATSYAKSIGASCYFPQTIKDLLLPNLGEHYIENASLSIFAAQLFAKQNNINFNYALAVETLKNRSWAGRMQKLPLKNTCYILDGAHNSHAVKRLAETLDKYYNGQKFHCIFGALKDKDLNEMVKLLEPHICAWHLTRTTYPRFRELDDLKESLKALNTNVESAQYLSRKYLDDILAIAQKDTPKLPVLITGSLYLIGETVELLKNDFDELSFFKNLTPTTNEHR